MDLNDTPRAFANRVQEAREAKGWTVAQLAARAGITRQTLYLLERQDGQCPTPQTMNALSEALGCDRAWLFYVTSSDGADAA